MREICCDVLVIGAGGGALRAAIAACETNPELKVQIVTRGKFGKSGVTATACSDRMAFHATLPYTEPGGEDNWRYHADDIYRIGGYVSDPELAEILAKNSGKAAMDLVEYGVPFVRDAEGKLDQFITDGSDYARACYTGPYTANHISQALCRKVEELGLPVLEEHYVFQLAVADGKVAGAWVLPERLPSSEDPKDHLLLIRAGAVILATGGAGEIYGRNAYPPGTMGDGYAMAVEAGASLVNMEFMQFTLVSPKTKLACSGSIMRAMPCFVNDKGEELSLPGNWPELIFAKGATYPISFEKATHKIDLLVARELEAGGRVYLDYSTNPKGFAWEKLSQRLRSLYRTEQTLDLGQKREESPLVRLKEINQPVIQWLAERGVDLEAGDLLEVHPVVQHFQGGVWINNRAETKLPGLFAVGEVAGGQHGANRPGGNALLDCQVFGRIAGENAAQLAGKQRCCTRRDLPEPSFPREGNGSLPAREVLERVRSLMDRYAAVIRWKEGLEAAEKELGALREVDIIPGTDSWDKVIEARTARVVASAIVKAQAMRRESRGPHLYFDSPEGDPRPTDPKYQRSICLTGPELVPSWIRWQDEEEEE